MEDAKSNELSEPKGRVVAAIPCFNEERFIGSVVLKTRKYVDKVVVIDDGSSDATAEIAGSGGALVCSHGQNMGVGAATKTALRRAREELASLPDFEVVTTEPPMRALSEALGLKAGQLFGIIRVAVTGTEVAPPLFDTMAVLGKEKCLNRIDQAIEALSSLPA